MIQNSKLHEIGRRKINLHEFGRDLKHLFSKACDQSVQGVKHIKIPWIGIQIKIRVRIPDPQRCLKHLV